MSAAEAWRGLKAAESCLVFRERLAGPRQAFWRNRFAALVPEVEIRFQARTPIPVRRKSAQLLAQTKSFAYDNTKKASPRLGPTLFDAHTLSRRSKKRDEEIGSGLSVIGRSDEENIVRPE